MFPTHVSFDGFLKLLFGAASQEMYRHIVLDLQSELSLVIKEISLKQFIAIFKNKNPRTGKFPNRKKGDSEKNLYTVSALSLQ